MIDQDEIHGQCFSKGLKKSAKELRKLKNNFSSLLDKQQAWSDLHRLLNDENSNVRKKAVDILGFVFPDVSDKQQAWDDLHRLLDDENSSVRIEVAKTLGFVFPDVSDKQQALDYLHKLLYDEDFVVRIFATFTFQSIFSQVTDKQQAWDDLHTLLNDKCTKTNIIKSRAVVILSSVFSQAPDIQKAWDDLHTLLYDKDDFTRRNATVTLGTAFPYVLDKQQAWDDLHRLTKNEDSLVVRSAADALGSVFSHIPDKQQAWEDLQRLTNDMDNEVSIHAYHSLGRISIFKASQAKTDTDYKKELEKAIEFFEKATQNSPNWSNPSRFCHPFYCLFYATIFEKQEAKNEVNKYMEEAKSAIKRSKSKKLLLEIVENLMNVVEKVNNLGNLDLQIMQDELNHYRIYCDRAEELMKETEETTPYATAAMRKGLPILDRNLKELIEEIQNKAKIACQESQGTPTQEIACAINREVQKWEIGNQEEIAYSVCREVQRWEIRSQEEMSLHVANIILVLKSKIPHVPENKGILGMIESINYEKDLSRVLCYLSTVIGLIPTVNVVPVEPVIEKIESLEGKLDAKFEEMIVSLKSGPREELVISKGLNMVGSGAQLVTTIPLAEMKYPEISIDLDKIKEEGTKLSELPRRFIDKIKGYLP